MSETRFAIRYADRYLAKSGVLVVDLGSDSVYTREELGVALRDSKNLGVARLVVGVRYPECEEIEE